MKHAKSNSGLTLVETLIYAALISVVIGMIVVVAFQVIDANSNLGEIVFLEEEANFILRKISWAISGASDINSPGSGNISTSTLSIDKFETGAGENPLIFSISEGSILLKRGNTSSTPLNSAFVTIQNATFTHIMATGTAPAGIKVELAIRNTATSKTRAYSITSYLRP